MSDFKTKTARLDWIDMAKGYGMLAIIAGHLGSFGNFEFIKIWLFSFHVPLFFFLSGYVFKDYGNWVKLFKRKIKSIIVPYFCLGIPTVLFKILWSLSNHELTKKAVIELIKNFIVQKRTWSLWFLTCLFILNLVFYFAKKLNNRLLFVISAIAVSLGILYYSLGGKELPLNIDVCFMAFPFFFAGYYCKCKSAKINAYFKNKPHLIILILLLAVNISFCYINLRCTGVWFNMYSSKYGCAPLTYISAFAGIGALIIISKLTLVKPIRYIGENSILYLAWHDEIMIPVAEKCIVVFLGIINVSFENVPILLRYTIEITIIVSIITILNIVISNSCFCFILGKTKKRRKTPQASN